MAISTISARIDAEDKAAFDSFCDSVGMSVSTALNLFIKAVLREQRIPFPIETDPFFSKENQAYLMKSIRELEAGKGQAHTLIEVRDNE